MIPFTILKLNFLYPSTKEKRFRFIALGNYNTFYFQIKITRYSPKSVSQLVFCVTTIIKIVNNNTNDKQTSGISGALDEDSP